MVGAKYISLNIFLLILLEDQENRLVSILVIVFVQTRTNCYETGGPTPQYYTSPQQIHRWNSEPLHIQGLGPIRHFWRLIFAQTTTTPHVLDHLASSTGSIIDYRRSLSALVETSEKFPSSDALCRIKAVAADGQVFPNTLQRVSDMQRAPAAVSGQWQAGRITEMSTYYLNVLLSLPRSLYKMSFHILCIPFVAAG